MSTRRSRRDGAMQGLVLRLALVLLPLTAIPAAAAQPTRTPRTAVQPLPPPAGPPPPAFLVSTISDIGRSYTVIDTACVFQAFPKTAASGDPIEEAMSEAFRRMRKIAVDAGSNGLLGYDIDFANPGGKEPGRLLLCGTLVRIR